MAVYEPTSVQILAWFTAGLAEALPPGAPPVFGVKVSDPVLEDFRMNYGLRVQAGSGRASAMYAHTVRWAGGMSRAQVEAAVRETAEKMALDIATDAHLRT